VEQLAPHQAREAAAAHYRGLTAGAGGINLAQFRAQLYEEQAVELLAGFMNDITLPAPFRRDCAKDVLLYARGAIKPWEHDGVSVDISATGRTGATIGEEIEAARLTAAAYEAINRLCMRQVPVDAWPEELRAFADPSMVAAFSVTDA
jgi:hypothetical protein